MWPSKKKYEHEIFLSHAVADKAAIADELCARLKKEGIKVWYSGDELAGGGDLQKAIEEAIRRSRFGVVIFSKTFITRNWTLKELSWLEIKEADHPKVILAVLHEMSYDEFSVFSPHLASKFYLHASRGLDYVVKKIVAEILEERAHLRKARRRWLTQISLLIVALLTASALIAFSIYNHKPTDTQINDTINERIQTCLSSIENKNIRLLRTEGIKISQSQLDSTRRSYDALKSYYRNEYEFNNCLTSLSSRKRVEKRLGRDVVEMAGQPGYGLDPVDMYWSNRMMENGWHHAGFSLVNKRAVNFSWTGHHEGSGYVVNVIYTNPVRFINVSLSIPPSLTGTKRHEMTILGFFPAETYYFEENPEDAGWYLKSIE